MKCFLHIGTEKTGTTTIQAFLGTNRSRLLEKGFIYTQAAGRRNNHALAVAAYKASRRDGFTTAAGISSAQQLFDFRKTTLDSLRKEIDEVRAQGSAIIFSSEQFQARLTETEEIESLRDILLGLDIDEVSVIVYLRRPADIACSQFSTLLKVGMLVDAPPEPNNPVTRHICNHKGTIERFGAVFGTSSVIPRLFDKGEFANGSIIDDIAHVIGIPDDGNFDVPNELNKSLSSLGVALLRRLNKSIPYWANDPLRNDLISYITQYLSDGKNYVMPRRLYEQYDMAFRDSNEWVRSRYFPGRESLFSTDIPEESTLGIRDDEMERIAGCIASIWNDKQQRTPNLTAGRTSRVAGS